MPTTNFLQKNRQLSGFLILFASVMIFAIAIAIQQLLASFELTAMYISFCAGFILFTPLVSLALHPLLLSSTPESNQVPKSNIIANVALVALVQGLFFLIWMTDAIAIYSLYVDTNSFLAKAFNISSKKEAYSSNSFYWFNISLAWLFAMLSLVLGILPCMIARLKNFGVVGNFVSAFKFARTQKWVLSLYAIGLAMAVLLPLMYSQYLFLILFPLTLIWLFIALTKRYLGYLQQLQQAA
ncbi:hypothetical protein SAMN05216262_10857 [Colwellia chukchiensis]|uniref:Uncharacterized protein n=1 Tax=Colwellia chukchiensis TaxID=641665 RepID=A0A1H7NQE8_9GAMM|nr:hypothetical protein [Colwellia chukchiensis]SEL25763.1 hypothetical protein SAMN05216262_10857 [Colwellia chukchiensis]